MKNTKSRIVLPLLMIIMILLHTNASAGTEDYIQSNLIDDPYKDIEVVEMKLDEIELDGEITKKEAAFIFNRVFGLTEKTNLSDFIDLIDLNIDYDPNSDRFY